VLRNDHKGIYHTNPLVKGKPKVRESLQSAAKLLAGDDSALRSVFDDIDPHALSEMKQSASGPKDIPLDTMSRKFDFGRMAELAGGEARETVEPTSSSRLKLLEERQEKMLEMRRKQLDIPVNGGAAPQPRRVLAEAPVAVPSHLDIPPFEVIPGA
jgi:hypothetical protein